MAFKFCDLIAIGMMVKTQYVNSRLEFKKAKRAYRLYVSYVYYLQYMSITFFELEVGTLENK